MWYDLTGQDSDKLLEEWNVKKEQRKVESQQKLEATLKSLAAAEQKQIEVRKKEREALTSSFSEKKGDKPKAIPNPPTTITTSLGQTVQDTTQRIKDSVQSGELAQGATNFQDQAINSIQWLGNSISTVFKSMTVLFLGMVEKLSGWFKTNAPDYYNNEIKPALESAQGALSEYGGKTYNFAANTAIPAIGNTAKSAYNYTTQTAIPAISNSISTGKSEKYYGYYTPRGTKNGILGTGEYSGLIRSTEAKYGIPEGYIEAIIAKESNGNPKAVSPADSNGLHGWGLGQFRNATAKGLTAATGVPIWTGNKVNMNPEIQIEAIGALLVQKRKAVRGHSWEDAAWAYNAGEGSVNRFKLGKGYGKLAKKIDPNYK
jgi:soluble lytic murein transglycosylase-like protein